MKINEVEAAVGVTKKNIRFYEEEGLISPRREPGNGYRSYSEADVERLRRIKLLRKLDVPLAEIRQMLEGECTLAEGMTRQLERLHTRRTDLDEAVNFCTLLQKEPVSLNELDVEQTLARLTAKEEQGVSFVNIEQTDRKAERVRGALVGAGLFTAIMLLSIGIMAWAFCVDPQDVPPLPLLVVDMGTATTMSVINEKEEFIGGAIMPGLRLSLEALSSKASLLPHIDLIPPKSVIGRNTVDAMDSGIIYGAASMLDGMIDRIQQELGQPVQAVATGGLSKKVTPYCRHSIIQDPNLLLKGLRILYYKNVK